MRDLGSDAAIAWVCWSTKALVATSEAVELAGDILRHQSGRLRRFAERRFRQFLDREQPSALSSPAFRDAQHGAPPAECRWAGGPCEPSPTSPGECRYCHRRLDVQIRSSRSTCRQPDCNVEAIEDSDFCGEHQG